MLKKIVNNKIIFFSKKILKKFYNCILNIQKQINIIRFNKKISKNYELIDISQRKIILLSLLNQLHDFCTTNNIRYYLHAGTLLGAVRHKGFIPWDDDLDVSMPREDYEKFLKLIKSSNNTDFYVANYKNVKYYPPAFSKFCRKGTEAVINRKFCGYGIGIDIFPIDGFPNDINERDIWFNKHKEYFFNVYLDKVFFELYGEKNPIKYISRKLKQIIVNSNKAAKNINENAKKNIFSISEYAGCSVGIFRGKPEIAKRESFEDKIEIEFEGHKYNAPIGWKDILTSIYGSDFMQPPPENKRTSTHEEDYYIKRK